MKIFDRISFDRSSTIREELFNILRKRILTGEAPPGTRLIESKLAEDIGTSRTPVREALHSLERENLLKSIPRVGYVVREISDEEVEEIIEIRVVLETLAAKWAAARITKPQLKRLEKILEVTNRCVQRKETSGVVELDTEFHEIICKASGSKRIVEMGQTLRDHMLRFRMISLRVPEIAGRANEGHGKIVEAIKKEDFKAIEAAVRYHMDFTKRDIIYTIREGV